MLLFRRTTTIVEHINHLCKEGEWMLAQSLMENHLDLFQQEKIYRHLTSEAMRLLKSLKK